MTKGDAVTVVSAFLPKHAYLGLFIILNSVFLLCRSFCDGSERAKALVFISYTMSIFKTLPGAIFWLSHPALYEKCTFKKCITVQISTEQYALDTCTVSCLICLSQFEEFLIACY